MKEIEILNEQQSLSAHEGSVSVVTLLTALARRKAWLVSVPFVAVLCAVAGSLLMPPTFTSSTQLLPPQQAQSGAAAILAQLGGVAAAVGGASGAPRNPNDVYVAMLSSRTVADSLISRFDLRKVYVVDSLEEARRELRENSSIRSGKDGLISVEVADRDRRRAALLANAYVEELIRLTKVLAVTDAGQRRIFFERELEKSKNNLAAAELALKKALEVSGVISVEGDSRAVIETVGRLRAQISSKEVQLNAMKAFVTRNNQEYRRVEEELAGLRGEFSRLQHGSAAGVASKSDAIDKRGLESVSIWRDVKYYQMLYELLAKQYEAARLDEAKDISLIQVLDRAIEPERKSSPKIVRNTLLAAVLAFLMVAAIVIILDIVTRFTSSPEGARQWAELRAALGRRRTTPASSLKN